MMHCMPYYDLHIGRVLSKIKDRKLQLEDLFGIQKKDRCNVTWKDFHISSKYRCHPFESFRKRTKR